MTAWKQDAGKPRMDLVPPELVEGAAGVLTFGADKYGPRNWERGMDWGRVFGALQRHLWAFWGGEDRDPETGLPHTHHAACCIAFLMAYEARGLGNDDRARNPAKTKLPREGLPFDAVKAERDAARAMDADPQPLTMANGAPVIAVGDLVDVVGFTSTNPHTVVEFLPGGTVALRDRFGCPVALGAVAFMRDARGRTIATAADTPAAPRSGPPDGINAAGLCGLAARENLRCAGENEGGAE